MKSVFSRFILAVLCCMGSLLLYSESRAQDSAHFYSHFCRFWKPTTRVINGKSQPAKVAQVMFGYFSDGTYVISENGHYGAGQWRWNNKSKLLFLANLSGTYDTFSVIGLNDTMLAIQMRKPNFRMTQYMRPLAPKDSAEMLALLYGKWWVTGTETEVNGIWEKDTTMKSEVNFSFCFSASRELLFEDEAMRIKDTSAWMLGYTPDEVLLQLGDMGFTRCFIQKLNTEEMILETYAMGYAHRRLRFKRLSFSCP